jgi:hypothetical protein
MRAIIMIEHRRLVLVHQRSDYEAHVLGVSTSIELYDNIGNNKCAITSNYETAGEEKNVGVTSTTTGETITTTDYDDYADDNVTTTADGFTTTDDGLASTSTTGDSLTTTDEVTTMNDITVTTIGVIGTTNTDEFATIDDVTDTTDDSITTTDDNTATTGDNYSDAELPTTGTTSATIPGLSSTTDNYSDCAIHHLTRSRHYACRELTLVRYGTSMVKPAPTETTSTQSDDVTPPDGRIQ